MPALIRAPLSKLCAGPWLAAAFVLPLNSPQRWQLQAYSGIAPHHLSFGSAGLHIAVAASAQPLIYPLKEDFQARGLRVSAHARGLPRLKAGLVEGAPGNDDFALRVGFVIAGRHTLNFFRRLFAPAWLRPLLRQAGERGLDRVEFFDVAQTLPSGEAWQSGAAGILHQRVVKRLAPAAGSAIQDLSFEEHFATALPVSALWISCDGDDTASSFDVDLERVELSSD